MALALAYGCQLTIWRYLRDEERAFLEKLYPGFVFQESREKKSAETGEVIPITTQDIANFAAQSAWNEALNYLRGSMNLSEALAVAAQAGQVSTITLIHGWGGRDLPKAFSEAMANGHCEAATEIKELHGMEFETETTVEGLNRAASGGHLRIIKSAVSWKEFYDAEIFISAAASGQVHILEYLYSVVRYGRDVCRAYDLATGGDHANVLSLIDKRAAGDNATFTLRQVERFLVTAIRHGSLKAMAYFKSVTDAREFTNEKLNHFLRVAAINCQSKSMKLLKEWGARDFVGSLFALVDRIIASKQCDLPIAQLAPLELLRSWGVPPEEFRRNAERITTAELQDFAALLLRFSK